MSKEELEKEAEEWAKDHHYYNGTVKGYVSERDSVINAYLASAEPREKQIADLEEKLVNANNQLEDRDLEIKKLKETYKKQRNKRIDGLQKENAELKETLKTYNGCGDWDNDFHTCRVYLQHEELQECMEQLTKAKEHIQTLISCLIDWVQKSDKDYQYIAEAEQFLRETDIDNAIQQANEGLNLDKIADEMEQDLKENE